MIIGRALAAAFIVGAAALGLATPASAAEPMQGFYVYQQPGEPPWTWEIMPTCVQAGCVLHITASSPHFGTLSDRAPWHGDARPSNGLWTIGVNRLDAWACPDGSKKTLQQIFAFDDATLAGTVTTLYGPECGAVPKQTKAPITLTYAGPLPYEVIVDPLNQLPDQW